MIKSALLSLLFGISSVAGDVIARSGKNTTYISKFDDLAGLDDWDAAFRTIEQYDGLAFYLFDLVNVPQIGTGVVPRSGPNTAVYFQDRPYVPVISTSDSFPPANSFDLESFYFGCTFGPSRLIRIGVSRCIVTVTGSRNGQTVAVQSFAFTPKLTLQANMVQAKLSVGFKNIDRATFRTDYNAAVTRSGRTLVDNVRYTAHEI
ncbi:hypothetical protein BKA67DRAFT_690903 [Truncatella angustata]|uniref:Uncharacterized protein n=1 Tax=Truncatella angustata TaxID=152316 RepID=A0A9P8UKH8_9PEZI|nr:uncharacterized protein BKA67DRAFT_690903 [Truncatella angustata]KAH6653784.1 hypothetical protein BKA67DRAFT_690903 [Truncatella angustata]